MWLSSRLVIRSSNIDGFEVVASLLGSTPFERVSCSRIVCNRAQSWCTRVSDVASVCAMLNITLPSHGFAVVTISHTGR